MSYPLAPPPLPSPRAPRWRVAIAGLCLVAQAFALVHLFAVRHVRCAEHGEMVHVDGAAAAGGTDGSIDAMTASSRHVAMVAQAEASPEDPAVLAASGLEVEAHQDDHCMALSERRDLRTGAVKQVVSSPQVLGELCPEHREPLLVVRPIYRLAPKISPPAVA